MKRLLTFRVWGLYNACMAEAETENKGARRMAINRTIKPAESHLSPDNMDRDFMKELMGAVDYQ